MSYLPVDKLFAFQVRQGLAELVAIQHQCTQVQSGAVVL